MAQQFQLRGATLEDLAREAAETFGSAARIVRAERVLDAGLGGFLGRRHIEVTVHVPDEGEPPVVAVAPAVPHLLQARTGIAALLEDAESAEDALGVGAHGVRRPSVSTEETDFDSLLRRLRREVDADAVPVPLSGPGDLVLVVGLGETAADVARSVAEFQKPGAPWTLFGSGACDMPGRPYLAGRWDAGSARALAVEEGRAALVACSLGMFSAGLPHLGSAAELGADQVWLVVDARHKSEDTAEWVECVRSALAVDALAIIGAAETRAPHTVNRLGIPLGWVDGSPAPGTVL